MPGIFNWIRPNVLLGDSEPRNAGYFQHLFLAQVGHGWHLCRIRGNLLASPSKRRDVLAGQHFQHRGRNKLSLAWQVALYSAPGQSGLHARRGWWTRDVEPVRGRVYLQSSLGVVQGSRGVGDLLNAGMLDAR